MGLGLCGVESRHWGLGFRDSRSLGAGFWESVYKVPVRTIATLSVDSLIAIPIISQVGKPESPNSYALTSLEASNPSSRVPCRLPEGNMFCRDYTSQSLHSQKRVDYIGDSIGEYLRVITGSKHLIPKRGGTCRLAHVKWT